MCSVRDLFPRTMEAQNLLLFCNKSLTHFQLLFESANTKNSLKYFQMAKVPSMAVVGLKGNGA